MRKWIKCILKYFVTKSRKITNKTWVFWTAKCYNYYDIKIQVKIFGLIWVDWNRYIIAE